MSALVLFGGAKKVPFVPIGQGVWGGGGVRGIMSTHFFLAFGQDLLYPRQESVISVTY